MTNWFGIIGVTVALVILLAAVLLSGQVDGPSGGDSAEAEAEGSVFELDEASAIPQLGFVDKG